MLKEFYKCLKSGNPRKRNPYYKTPDRLPRSVEVDINIGKSGYENEDISRHWGPMKHQ